MRGGRGRARRVGTLPPRTCLAGCPPAALGGKAGACGRALAVLRTAFLLFSPWPHLHTGGVEFYRAPPPLRPGSDALAGSNLSPGLLGIHRMLLPAQVSQIGPREQTALTGTESCNPPPPTACTLTASAGLAAPTFPESPHLLLYTLPAPPPHVSLPDTRTHTHTHKRAFLVPFEKKTRV